MDSCESITCCLFPSYSTLKREEKIGERKKEERRERQGRENIWGGPFWKLPKYVYKSKMEIQIDSHLHKLA